MSTPVSTTCPPAPPSWCEGQLQSASLTITWALCCPSLTFLSRPSSWLRQTWKRSGHTGFSSELPQTRANCCCHGDITRRARWRFKPCPPNDSPGFIVWRRLQGVSGSGSADICHAVTNGFFKATSATRTYACQERRGLGNHGKDSESADLWRSKGRPLGDLRRSDYSPQRSPGNPANDAKSVKCQNWKDSETPSLDFEQLKTIEMESKRRKQSQQASLGQIFVFFHTFRHKVKL